MYRWAPRVNANSSVLVLKLNAFRASQTWCASSYNPPAALPPAIQSRSLLIVAIRVHGELPIASRYCIVVILRSKNAPPSPVGVDGHGGLQSAVTWGP